MKLLKKMLVLFSTQMKYQTNVA